MKIALRILLICVITISQNVHAENEFKKLGKSLLKAIVSPEKAPDQSPAQVNDKKSEVFIKPEVAGDFKYEITFEPSGETFPSFILSTQEIAKKMLESNRKPYMLGNYNGALSIYAQSTKPNSKIKLKIYKNELIKEDTMVEYILPDPSVVYEITPQIIWDYSKLSKMNQPENIFFKIGMQEEGSKPFIKTYQQRVRSVNDALRAYVNREGIFQDLQNISFTAYVNENHPMIDQVLKETKDLVLASKHPDFKNFGFVGKQAGPNEVFKQVQALWYYFQSRHFVYSSITDESNKNEKVWAQHVRTFEESLNYTQANCVDGTVMFASILKKLDIDPILVSVPRHMYLMFYLDNKGAYSVLETTMLGNYNATGKPGLIFKDKDFKKSIESFNEANAYGVANFTKNAQPFLQKKERGYALIPVSEFRKLGITPLSR